MVLSIRTAKILRLHFARFFTITSTHTICENKQNRPKRMYEWSGDDIEDLEQYRKGGFYPTYIADEIQNGRYRIVHKLGFGSFSTVWLAQDQHENRLVSLKFLRADTARETAESQILLHLRASHSGHAFVLGLLDEFEVESPNGSHRCLVTEALGPSIGTVIYESSGNRLPRHISRAVAAQCVKGLAYLHSCGVVHGDLHTGNILFNVVGMDNWTLEKVYESFGIPETEEVKRTDGQPATPSAPKYAVRLSDPAVLIRSCLTEPFSVTIVDFGEAYHPASGKLARELNTAVSVAAPEILFNDVRKVGMPADIWALACAIYEILGDHRLLESFFLNRDEILMEMVCMLGKLPDAWWHSWKARATYFAEDGTVKPTPDNPSGEAMAGDLNERVEKLIERTDSKPYIEFDHQERLALVRMLGAMLKYEPADRAQAEELVRLLPPRW